MKRKWFLIHHPGRKDRTIRIDSFPDEVGKKPLMGGEVRTRENNYRYGRYEVRMKPPGRGAGQGSATGFLATMFTFHTPRNRFCGKTTSKWRAAVKMHS